jgi:prevent-host-death family protein
MKKIALAEAKARISELVDQAEHHGQRILILRHGKPAAALVPVDVAQPPAPRRKRQSTLEATRSVREFVEEFSAAQPDVSSVDELLRDRR